MAALNSPGDIDFKLLTVLFWPRVALHNASKSTSIGKHLR